jgi:N-hydroxyarylamine O-acetyltransferase
MVLRVDLNGTSYIADAGFGAVTLTGPIILQTETPQRTPHEMFRLIAMGADELQLQVQLKNEWVRMYQFSLVPPPQIDFEVGNFFVWAYPESHFRKVLMASHVEAGKRFTLGNLTLTTRQVNGDTTQHEIETSDEFADVLRNVIGTQISKADAEAVFEKLKSVWPRSRRAPRMPGGSLYVQAVLTSRRRRHDGSQYGSSHQH